MKDDNQLREIVTRLEGIEEQLKKLVELLQQIEFSAEGATYGSRVHGIRVMDTTR
jgi:hypothetical protein